MNSRVALETTAAEARMDAPNPVVAHEVDINVEEAQEAAHQAAAHAKVCLECTRLNDMRANLAFSCRRLALT